MKTGTIQLDCRQMTSREAAHTYLAKMLDFPDYYGHNLDALYDCLTELSGPVCLELIHPEALNDLGGYGHCLLAALQDAAAETPDLEIMLRTEPGEI